MCEIGCKSCVLFTYCRQESASFSQPGANLSEIPCIISVGFRTCRTNRCWKHWTGIPAALASSRRRAAAPRPSEHVCTMSIGGRGSDRPSTDLEDARPRQTGSQTEDGRSRMNRQGKRERRPRRRSTAVASRPLLPTTFPPLLDLLFARAREP